MFTYNNDEMNKLSSIIYSRIIDISKVCLHEFRMIFKDEGVLIFVVLVPLLYPLLYSWIYNNEVVHEVPVAVVDNSHSAMSRKFTRAYDATPDVKVAYHCNSIEEAKRLVGRQEVYGILYFPTDFNTKLNRMQQSHISLYCNMGIMLTYKALYQSAMAVASDLNAQIQVSVSQNYTSREDEISTRPLDFDEVPIFNNTGGYGNFILPGVLVLILQQVLLLGIGMSMGTSMEEKRLQRISGMLAKPFGLGRIMIGRTGPVRILHPHRHIRPACRAQDVQLRAHPARLRLRPVPRALPAGVHFLRLHLLVLRKAERECHAACGVHISAVPVHVGRVMA